MSTGAGDVARRSAHARSRSHAAAAAPAPGSSTPPLPLACRGLSRPEGAAEELLVVPMASPTTPVATSISRSSTAQRVGSSSKECTSASSAGWPARKAWASAMHSRPHCVQRGWQGGQVSGGSHMCQCCGTVASNSPTPCWAADTPTHAVQHVPIHAMRLHAAPSWPADGRVSQRRRKHGTAGYGKYSSSLPRSRH